MREFKREMHVQVRISIQNQTARYGLASILLLSVLVLLALGGSAQETKKLSEADSNPAPAFVEADGVRLIDELRRALETENRGRFLKAFDAKRMPGYPAFRDQVADFFARYGEFQVRYHVTQVTMDGDLGAEVADFEVDATPRDGVSPNLRKRVALRLVCGWDGKQWKVVDLSPRTWLE
jgi:hypothetical protein